MIKIYAPMKREELRDRLAKQFEHQMCVTRKLFCPSAYELADVVLQLDKPSTFQGISSRVNAPEEKLKEAVEILEKKGYIQQTEGKYERTGKII